MSVNSSPIFIAASPAHVLSGPKAGCSGRTAGAFPFVRARCYGVVIGRVAPEWRPLSPGRYSSTRPASACFRPPDTRAKPRTARRASLIEALRGPSGRLTTSSSPGAPSLLKGDSAASSRTRKQCRTGPQGPKKEASARRRLSGNEAAPLFREAFRATGQREGGSDTAIKEGRTQAAAARGPASDAGKETSRGRSAPLDFGSARGQQTPGTIWRSVSRRPARCV